MALGTIQYYSRALRKASAFQVMFPDDPEIRRPWSTLYVLHGLSDDHTIWGRRTSLERYVEGLPLVVVMPDGGRGWYTNARIGSAYEDDLIHDLVPLIDRTFPVRAERSGRAIGGLSMGGFGAIKNALKHSDLFCSAHSHSGALGVCRDPESAERLGPEFTRIFGEAPADGPEDPFALVMQMDHGRIPRLRLDCGREDFLLEQNRAFHAHLDSLHIAHEYEEYDGGHDWAYWDLHVWEAIAFHRRNLGLV
ncbi:MAG: tributyrin esterase [Isosphaeraceae bacterium]|jgi:S-formylglutathione hydrolase FrmB|nr:MAG: tributyrin esterase [Isosphaeraceae bacterium]